MSPRTLGRFTAPELGVLAEMLSIAAWPLPLQVRLEVAMQEQVRAATLAAQHHLTEGRLLRNGRLDADLEEALFTLTHPTLSVDVVGASGLDTSDVVRIVAAYRGGAVVLAHQITGTSSDIGGDVVVQSTTWDTLAADLAALLLRQLPPAQPGRMPAVSVRRADLADARDATLGSGNGRVERDLRQLAELGAQQFDTYGQLGVTAYFPDGLTGRRVSLAWFDVAGDGRYLNETSQGTSVSPCDVGSLAGALAEQLARQPVPVAAG